MEYYKISIMTALIDSHTDGLGHICHDVYKQNITDSVGEDVWYVIHTVPSGCSHLSDIGKAKECLLMK